MGISSRWYDGPDDVALDGMLAGLIIDDINSGSKSEGSMSDGSESLSDTSSILAFRDMMDWGMRSSGGVLEWCVYYTVQSLAHRDVVFGTSS